MCKIPECLDLPEHLSEKFKILVVYSFLKRVILRTFSVLKNNKFYVGTPAQCHTHSTADLWRSGLCVQFCGIEHITRERQLGLFENISNMRQDGKVA
jgi:hypothetical protein